MVQKDYGPVLMLNLLKEASDREQLLTTSIKYILEENAEELGNVSYYHHDFHNIGIKNLHKLMDGTEEFVTNKGYYCEELSTNTVIKNQTGIVRTNCMD
jgi:hypothetical protein